MSTLTTGAIIAEDFFQYAIVFAFVTGLENFNTVIPVQSDAHFVCTSTMFDSTLVAPYATAVVAGGNGGALIQLIDGATTRALSNIQVPINTLFGTAREPYIWPKQHTFKANAPIGINITGTSGAAMTIRLTFAGIKIPV